MSPTQAWGALKPPIPSLTCVAPAGQCWGWTWRGTWGQWWGLDARGRGDILSSVRDGRSS